MNDKPNIREQTKAICETLGLEPSLVARLDITPSTVTATVYRTDENGSKFIDEVTELAATDEVFHRVVA